MLDKIRGDYQAHDTPFTDSLTGLFNHGFFQTVFSREIKLSNRYQRPFSLALIDIDSFSFYNRQNGALEGDKALRAISTIIMEQIREADLAARFSGNVFAILLANTDEECELAALERVRDAVSRHFVSRLTVSTGVASYPRHGNNRDDILNSARIALQRAKLKGKNSIYFFEKQSAPQASDRPTVLVADDNPNNVKLLETMLQPLNFNIAKASSGLEALSLVGMGNIDLVLLDIMMPEMDGIELCRRIKSQESTRIIPVVMVTTLDDRDTKVRAIDAGADDFLTKPPDRLELIARTRSLMQVKMLNENMVGFESALIALANAVEAKDPYTEGHIQRVSNLAVQLGRRLNLKGRELEALRIGGILHDIGKIGIPDRILLKEGSLSADEWKIMKEHPLIGFKVAKPMQNYLHQALDIIRYHHERLDGSGYPDGLKGEEICITARIMAVVDLYDALITKRPYRRELPHEDALRIIKEEAAAGKIDREITEELEIMLK